MSLQGEQRSRGGGYGLQGHLSGLSKPAKRVRYPMRTRLFPQEVPPVLGLGQLCPLSSGRSP